MAGDIATDSLQALNWIEDRTIHVRYQPQRDITAYELSMILYHFSKAMTLNVPTNLPIRRTVWLALPTEIKRHFEVL